MGSDRAPVAHQAWRDMIFLHWPVDPMALRRFLPSTLAVDQRAGSGWVSLLPFRALAGRPAGAPRFLGMDYVEVNLRTYVTWRGEPGIWMFSLDASSRLAAWGGRTLLGLPFAHARITRHGHGREHGYTCLRDGGGHLRVRAAGDTPPEPPAPGTLDAFLLERYALFVQHRGALVRVQVLHAPLAVSTATVLELDEDLTTTAGLFVDRARLRAHVSPGVSVTFLAPERVAAAALPPDIEARAPV